MRQVNEVLSEVCPALSRPKKACRERHTRQTFWIVRARFSLLKAYFASICRRHWFGDTLKLLEVYESQILSPARCPIHSCGYTRICISFHYFSPLFYLLVRLHFHNSFFSAQLCNFSSLQGASSLFFFLLDHLILFCFPRMHGDLSF